MTREQRIKISASEPTISELARVLLEEIHLYEKYAELIKGDSERMTLLKVDELEESNKAKATLLLKIQTVEQARQKLVAKISEEKKITQETVSVSHICEHLNANDSLQLQQLRDRLQTVIQEIREVQEEASYLVRSSLTWIDGSMSNLKRILTPSGIYDARGKVGNKSTFSGRVVENKA